MLLTVKPRGLKPGVPPNGQRRSLGSATKLSSETSLLLITRPTKATWCRGQTRNSGRQLRLERQWPRFVPWSIVRGGDHLHKGRWQLAANLCVCARPWYQQTTCPPETGGICSPSQREKGRKKPFLILGHSPRSPRTKYMKAGEPYTEAYGSLTKLICVK